MEVTARNSKRARKTKIYFKQFNISQSLPNHKFSYKYIYIYIYNTIKKRKRETQNPSDQVPSSLFLGYIFSATKQNIQEHLENKEEKK
jgi:hypothetical protein